MLILFIFDGVKFKNAKGKNYSVYNSEKYRARLDFINICYIRYNVAVIEMNLRKHHRSKLERIGYNGGDASNQCTPVQHECIIYSQLVYLAYVSYTYNQQYKHTRFQ